MGAAKEVKTLVNAERSLCWGGADEQMKLYYASKVLQI